MKNYLVIPASKCNKSAAGPAGPQFLDVYKKMAELQIKSAYKNLKNLDDVFIIDKEFDSTEQLFEYIFHYVYDLAHKEEFNILQAMSDTLYIRETNIFDVYKDFSLFGCCPGTLQVPGNPHPLHLDSVRYYPHTMEEETWDWGKKLWSNSEIMGINKNSYWGYEMVVYASMFYKQRDGFYIKKDGGIYNNLLNHLKNTSHLACKTGCRWESIYGTTGMVGNYQWTPCDEDDACILEYSATRGHEEQLRLMKEAFEKYINE